MICKAVPTCMYFITDVKVYIRSEFLINTDQKGKIEVGDSWRPFLSSVFPNETIKVLIASGRANLSVLLSLKSVLNSSQ